MRAVGFRLDQDHEVLAHRQVLRMLDFPLFAIAHLDDERLKRGRGQQLDQLLFHATILARDRPVILFPPQLD